MPDVSVIIPVYNGIKFVDQLINKLKDQTHQSVEFIIVDDGSTDGTTEHLKQLTLDERFKVLYKTNGGVSAARNFAIAQSSGTYIMFIDADDTPLPTMVAAYHEKIVNSNNDFEFFESQKVDFAGTNLGPIGAYHAEQLNRSVSRNEMFAYIGQQFVFGYPFLSISKAQLWSDTSFDSTIKYQEDTLALAKILAQKPDFKAGFNKEVHYLYLQNPESALHQMPISGYIDILKVSELIIGYAQSAKIDSLSLKVLNGLKISGLMSLLAVAALTGDKATFKKYRPIYLKEYRKTIFPEAKVKLRKAIQYFAVLFNIKAVLVSAYKNIYKV